MIFLLVVVNKARSLGVFPGFVPSGTKRHLQDRTTPVRVYKCALR